MKILRNLLTIDPFGDHFLGKASRVLILLGFVGFFVIFVNVLMQIYETFGTKVASGNNGILLSLAILLGLIYWQYKDLQKLLSGDGTIGQKIAFKIILVMVLISCVYLIFYVSMAYIFPESNNYSLQSLNKRVLTQYWPSSDLFEIIFTTLVNLSVQIGIVMAFAGFAFLCGKASTGLALAIAVHNYFNGQSFDLSALYDIVLDFSVPELLGTAVTIGWFFISVLIGKDFD